MNALFNTRFIITATFLIIAGMLGFIVVSTLFANPTTNELEAEGYQNIGEMGTTPCAATSPQCGVCMGKIVNGYCYEKP